MMFPMRLLSCFSHAKPLVTANRSLHVSAMRWMDGASHTLSPRGPIHDEPSDQIDSNIPFSDLGLHPRLVDHLSKLGYHTAFEIQAKTLPHSLPGRNIMGKAITGSGKTLAYALPIIHRLASIAPSRKPRALVITPTRELCRQVTSSISSLSDELFCLSIYGGDSYYRQERHLQRGVDVVCATPGRLGDHIRNGRLLLDNIHLVILDEADELLRPNFKDEIDSILHMTPEDKQVMLFSATLPPDVRHVIGRHMRDPISIDLTSSSSLVPQSITHNVLKVDVFEKFNVVLKLLRYHNPTKAIVFTPTKRQARGLGDFLVDNNIRAASLHSDLSQNARERILDKFRGGELKVIAATDVAARGIDIPEINLIIQVDPPPSGIDYYIHRSGRTGRKGLVGTSMLLLSHDRASDEFLRDLKRVVKVKFIRPPTAGEVMNAGLVNAAKCISEFNDDKLIEDAMPLADELLKTDGIKALASAIVEVYSSSLKGIVDGNDGRQWMDDRQGKMNDRSYGDPMDGDRYTSRSLYGGDYMERERRTKDRPFNRSINDHHRYRERSFNRSYGERRMKDRAYDGYMRSGMNDERYNHFDYKDDHDDDGRIDVGDFNEVK